MRDAWFGAALVGTVGSCLVLASASLSEDTDSAGQNKAASERKPHVVQVDLNKLPPDLAKQVMKYVGGEKAKPSTSAETKGPPRQLPPGLANKPQEHPGRMNFIKNVLGGRESGSPGGKGKKPSKDGEGNAG